MLSLDQIKDLIDHVVDRGVAVVEVERSGFRLRIEGAARVPVSDTIVTAEVVEPAATPDAPAAAIETTSTAVGEQPRASAAPRPRGAPSADEAPAQAGSARANVPADAHVLASPIVGTFYAAPSPDSPPFVQPGEAVHKGQVVCIVEAMKLMNEVECDVDGVVIDTLASNGQPVEFGQPLLAIRTDSSP